MTRWCFAVWIVLLGGCVATETGNPSGGPFVTTSVVSAYVEDPPMLPGNSATVIEGGPGSITPAIGEVLAWVLTNADPPARANVAADGSFRIVLDDTPGGLIRVRARDAFDRYSAPYDLPVGDVVSSGEDLLCAEVEPAAATDVEGSAIITLRNDCGVPIVRSRARLRMGGAGFALVDEGPTTLAAGETVEIEVRSATAARGADDIVLFEFERPSRALRAISIVAR